MVKVFVSHFDAGVDGTDEEDVGEDDKDADVKANHKHCAVEERKTGSLGCITPISCSLSNQNHISCPQFSISGKLGKATYRREVLTLEK